MTDRQDDDLPQALRDALRAADRAPPTITAAVDRAVARGAEAQFGARRWRAPGAWAAAAGAVLAVALLLLVPRPDEPRSYRDVDGSGTIDIADVLALARQSGAASQADLDAFAMRVVALRPENAR